LRWLAGTRSRTEEPTRDRRPETPSAAYARSDQLGLDGRGKPVLDRFLVEPAKVLPIAITANPLAGPNHDLARRRLGHPRRADAGRSIPDSVHLRPTRLVRQANNGTRWQPHDCRVVILSGCALVQPHSRTTRQSHHSTTLPTHIRAAVETNRNIAPFGHRCTGHTRPGGRHSPARPWRAVPPVRPVSRPSIRPHSYP